MRAARVGAIVKAQFCREAEGVGIHLPACRAMGFCRHAEDVGVTFTSALHFMQGPGLAGFADTILQICRAEGFSPDIAQETMEIQTAVDFLSAGRTIL